VLVYERQGERKVKRKKSVIRTDRESGGERKKERRQEREKR